MRKFSASLLAISFFVMNLCGCENQKELTLPLTQFVSQAKITTDDIEMVVEITANSVDDVRINVVSPDSIQGLSYHRVNSTLYIEYDELRCITTDDYLDGDNPFQVVFDVLDSISLIQLQKVSHDDGTIVYKGRNDNGVFNISIDDESGKILAVDPQYTHCEISFLYE